MEKKLNRALSKQSEETEPTSNRYVQVDVPHPKAW